MPPETVSPLAVQFKILRHIVPILSHDALRPLSNAKMTAAMLVRTPDAPVEALHARRQQLLGSMEELIDDSVDQLRGFGAWFSDNGRIDDVHDILCACQHLLHAQQRISGKMQLPDEDDTRRLVPAHGARYALLGWMLHHLQRLPAGGVLRIAYGSDTTLRAHLENGDGPPASAHDLPSIGADDADAIASHFGWQIMDDDESGAIAMPPTI